MPSQADQQQRWDTKYAAAVCVSSTAACEVLRSNLHLLPAQGRALDLACGLGANALLLAEQGLRVTARDISSVGLSTLERSAKASGLAIVSEQRDIEHNGVGGGQFDVICVSRYLHRPLCAAISRALNPGGLLFYQTFCEGKPAGIGPRSADFILQTNELLSLFAELKLLYYSEYAQQGDTSIGNRHEALYIGQQLSVRAMSGIAGAALS